MTSYGGELLMRKHAGHGTTVDVFNAGYQSFEL